MKKVIALSMLMLSTAPASAQWAPPPEVLQVRVRGEGAWTVSCQWQSRSGQPMSREVRGSGRDRWERLHLLESFSGACTFQAAPGQPLTIQLRSPLYRCTLPQPDGRECEQTFPAGTSGRFEIQERG
ncbi:hypothetical protein [Sphingomonas sp. DT-204]|uniref:hypothetical protein n=1 Tax=Sphingomonas sp. DT-204 TaxID=3396166 RepID=UPI003F1E2469